MPRQERRRALSALITILFSLAILVAPLVAMAVAQAQPQIILWNPSDYSAGAQDAPLVISDAQTGNDESEGVNENTYRLMATTQNTPNPATVEFELQTSSVTSITIGTATQVGADAWEYHWDIAGINDGQYTIRAILYSGTGLTAAEVDRHERPVLIRTGTPAGQTTAPAGDITYPANGAEVGFYTNPINGSTNTIIRAEFSNDTAYMEAFYTVSDPGDEPVWKSCAGPSFIGSSPGSEAGSIEFLCVLESADQGGLSVTGLGVVSNNTPQQFGENYDPNFNTAGDSIRILPYAQDAVSAVLENAEVRFDGTVGGNTSCSPAQFVVVTDQKGNPIARINVDVHARGPSDQLKFRVPGTPLLNNPPSAVKTPDKAHSGTERGWACDANTGQQFASTRQGDHNIPANPDDKHIESSSGTSNAGRFGIQLFSDRNGTTQITFWVDEDDDDQFCDDEPSAVASVGWNEPAPEPVGETATVTDCPIPTPPPPGGTPSSSGPSPTDTGGTEDCTHEGTSGDDQIVGTQGNDIICAGAGDDTIDGRGGDDIIRGEDGNDAIDGDIGEDIIDGGAGDDRMEGGHNNDTIDGFTGIDVLIGGNGDDTLRGGSAVDGFQGGTGRDVIQGGSGDDIGDGQAGADIMRGFTGEDILRGGGQGDTIRGMKNGDQLTGGAGPDNISGGHGRDQCRGGGGKDKIRGCET